MNPERLEAYHHLIKKLLTYPDQAAKILDTQPTLLDAGLLQVMQQVSNQIKAKGFPEKAYFLRSLMTQLKDELMPIVSRKTRKPSSKIDESGKTEESSVARIGNHQLRKSNWNESSVNWENEWQKFNLRVKKISSRDNRESHNEPEREEIYEGSNRISFLVLILLLIGFLILPSWAFWYRGTGGRFFVHHGRIELRKFQ